MPRHQDHEPGFSGPDDCQKKLGVLKSLWTMFPEDHKLVLVRDSFKGNRCLLARSKQMFQMRFGPFRFVQADLKRFEKTTCRIHGLFHEGKFLRILT
jgi:hypothetical protein